MCPDPEALAAFIEGNTYGLEERAIEHHLATCDWCLAEVALAARERHQQELLQQQAKRAPHRLRNSWLSFAAAAAVAGVAIGIVRLRSDSTPMTQLVAAAPHTSRTVEARLSGGFAWAPLRSAERGDGRRSTEDWELLSVAATVVGKSETDSSTDTTHVAAVAHLLMGEPAEATAGLRRIAGGTKDPRIWSDLAAALHEQAVRRDDDAAEKDALAAADAALQIDRDLLEALFNRALILERLNRTDLARSAWHRYLDVDPHSRWANEAREHLRRLRASTSDSRDTAPANTAQRLQTPFIAAAYGAAERGEWMLSLSFLDLELNRLTESGDARARADAFLMRARIKARLGIIKDAMADVTHAERAITAIDDRSTREHAEAQALAVQALLAPTSPHALAVLNRALDSRDCDWAPDRVAELYLARGRALAAAGRTDEAARDFDAGIREVEHPSPPLVLFQGFVGSTQSASQAWDSARDELFDEAITLAIAQGSPAQALSYAEYARSGHPVQPALAATHLTDDVIVEYVSLPSQLVIFVLRDGQLKATHRVVRRDTLSGEATQLRSAAGAGTAQFRRSASVLFTHLIEPIKSDLRGGDRIIFVPDATLRRVPFSALLAPDGTYLVERHAVVVAPSLSAATRFHRGSRQERDVLVISGPPLFSNEAMPLASARREADIVAALYGSRAERLVRGWNNLLFKRLASAADIIHFSGHATASDDDLDAALVTSSGRAGRLTTSDVATLNLDGTELVVLAACDTLSDRADGGISLARAFVDAGVHNVVGTLWDIPDGPAAQFFPRFHEHVAQGQSAAEALRSTQLEYIRSNNPPVMWAAVQVLGSIDAQARTAAYRPRCLRAAVSNDGASALRRDGPLRSRPSLPRSWFWNAQTIDDDGNTAAN